MSWQDRAYNQEGSSIFAAPRGRGGGGWQPPAWRGWSMAMVLLVANVAIFLLDSVLAGSARADALAPYHYFTFSMHDAIWRLQIWRWVTYSFIHVGFWHLFFNMLVLYFFGPWMEQYWGSLRFLVFYLLCAVGGAALMALLSMSPLLVDVTSQTRLAGASGSIFGILVGVAWCYPHRRVMLLIPPVPMPAYVLALIFLGIAVLSLLAGSRNAGGEAAHLGGALVGFVLVWRPGLLAWTRWLDPPALREHVSKSRARSAEARRQREEAEMDRILDKIRDKGLASLTAAEKKTLARASQQRQGR